MAHDSVGALVRRGIKRVDNVGLNLSDGMGEKEVFGEIIWLALDWPEGMGGVGIRGGDGQWATE